MKKENMQIRKQNMKLYPAYKKISWDYLFYYTINFLFFTQVKNMSASDVVIMDVFYSVFGILIQIPSTIIVEYLGKKNSLIFANIINCIYMAIIIFSRNIAVIIISQILSTLAFAIKETVEPSILNESVPKSKQKDKIFAHISEKGSTGYYWLDAISIAISGWLYEINPYIPMTISLFILIIAAIMSTLFIEPIKKQKINPKEISIDKQIKELRKSFKFVLKSERLRSLMIYIGVISGLLQILTTYQVSLLDEINLSSGTIGMISAGLGIISAIGIRNQEKFHNKHKNKSLAVIGLSISASCIMAGVFAIASNKIKILVVGVIIAYIIKNMMMSLYYSLSEKYLRNFANEKIDSKIYSVRVFSKNLCSAIIGIFASIIIKYMSTANSMIVVGILFSIIILLILSYMKDRLGLKPEEYSENERKYDELKDEFNSKVESLNVK